jgi:hypothetical protein
VLEEYFIEFTQYYLLIQLTFSNSVKRFKAELPYLKIGQPSPVKTVSIDDSLARRMTDFCARLMSVNFTLGSKHNSPAT